MSSSGTDNGENAERLPVSPDLDLHLELSGGERVDAILESDSFTTDEAVNTLDEVYKENQATFPHVIVATAMVHRTLDDAVADRRDGSNSRRSPIDGHIGPFLDRRAAEHWAKDYFEGNDAMTWRAERMETPQMAIDSRERMRQIADEPRDGE